MTQPRRPRYRTAARDQVERLTAPRRRAAEARAYAEEWYQALREWHLLERRAELVPSPTPQRRGGRMRVVGCGGIPAPEAWIHGHLMRTPIGEVSERAVARLCEGNEHLERLRAGRGLVSLCREEGGWNRERDAALAYARAVLTLAAALGDERAAKVLPALA